MTDRDRIKALPSWAGGEIPPERDHVAVEDVKGFTDVVRIFLRTWPFLLPMVIGYWRERPVVRWSRWNDRQSSGWSYRYVPVLATAVFLIGPISGWLDTSGSWQNELLFGATASMALMSWALILLRRRAFAVTAVTLVIVGSAANLFAILVVAGWRDNVQVGLVSFACLCMWLLQYRIAGGELQVRLRARLPPRVLLRHRLALHVVGVVPALFTIDLLNQSILQAKPLTPFLADFIGRPESGRGRDRGAQCAERQELQWVYMSFVMAIGFDELPASPGTAVLQRVDHAAHQSGAAHGARRALAPAVAALPRRSPGRRFGLRVYQDSAQVTAIIGMLCRASTQITQYG